MLCNPTSLETVLKRDNLWSQVCRGEHALTADAEGEEGDADGEGGGDIVDRLAKANSDILLGISSITAATTQYKNHDFQIRYGNEIIYIVINLLLVDIAFVLFCIQSVSMIPNQDTQNIYRKQMNNGEHGAGVKR